jgi:lysophospholipase L1-like esterase
MDYTSQDLVGFVFSLPWFGREDFDLIRFPRSTFGRLAKDVGYLSTNSAGGMIRFRAATGGIGIEIDMAPSRMYDKFSRAGQCGFDLYVDGKYYHTFVPPRDGYFISYVDMDASTHDFTIYLPTYSTFTLKSLGVDDTIDQPIPFSIPKPVVVYGSSITQGAFSSRPGLAYPAILGRRLDAEVVNLGFSGNGKCEPEVAELMAQIDASCYLMDAGGNLTSPEEEGIVQERYPAFLETLREAHPATPIICNNVQSILAGANDTPENRRLCDKVRQVIKDAYEARVAAGDENIYYTDGMDIICPDDDDCTADGTHANDLGFHRYVEVLEPLLKKILEVA